MRSVLATAELGYGPPSLEKFLGSLPVIRDLLARLDLVAVIDRLCPIQENKARHTHGEVIAMLVANRLTSPTPLVRVEDGGERWAVLEIFGIEPDALNDDRCGRALEALAEQADAVVGAIAARAIAVFGLDVSEIHWDLTSMSVFGAYDRADPAYATGEARPPEGPPLRPQAGAGRLRDLRRRRGLATDPRLRRRRRRGLAGGGRVAGPA